jgi:hypothetical protein
MCCRRSRCVSALRVRLTDDLLARFVCSLAWLATERRSDSSSGDIELLMEVGGDVGACTLLSKAVEGGDSLCEDFQRSILPLRLFRPGRIQQSSNIHGFGAPSLIRPDENAC